VATVGAMASLFEVPVAWLVEKKKMTRLMAALTTGGTMFALGILATLSPFFFNLFDFTSSNVLLPLGGLAIIIVAGWLMPKGSLADELGKGGAGTRWDSQLVPVFVKFITPVLVLLILLNSLGLVKF